MPLPDAATDSHVHTDLEREQEQVTRRYERLDALRTQTRTHLAEAAAGPAETGQARTEKDAALADHSARLARLEAAENGLCFGRLDRRDGDRFYLGRIGLPDESPDADPLLLDWRAPAARAFYVATSAAPEGVRRRRHIVTRGRRVLTLDDDVFDNQLDAEGEPLAGQAALLAAVNAGRTGRMGDIVATLQAEQDAIIRSDHRGILVVQGGPGTGKTAVALHRAAYLLYHHRRVATQGVLVVGPNPTFLTYIGQVLPGLGETSVLPATVGELFPGVVAERPDSEDPAAELKGRLVMAEVVAAAVRDRQAPPGPAFTVEVGDDTVRFEPEDWVAVADRARATRRPHNQARPVFVRLMIRHLAGALAAEHRALADRLEADVADALGGAGARDLDRAAASDLARLGFAETTEGQDPYGETAVDLEKMIAGDAGVRAALDRLWPNLGAQRLLTELFASPARIATAAPQLTDAERGLLLRTGEGRPGALGWLEGLEAQGWSEADVPLLDEAAELLGVDDRAARARAARARDQELAFAQAVLDIAAGSDRDDEELAMGDLIDAHRLAERHQHADRGSVADRAAADRTWTFGHIIVDEAQELSAMAWRLLLRRCPVRSMTLVGDVAQTSTAAGSTSWDEALEPFVGDRYRLTELTVNYRTPTEIMAATGELAATLGARPPTSVRSAGVEPWRLRTTPAAFAGRLAALAVEEVEVLGDGRLAVIVPDTRAAEIADVLREVLPDASGGAVAPDLAARVVVVGVGRSKGLEFDRVLVGDPAGILAASPRGGNDLYVALTRATQRLGILHPGPVPAVLNAIPTRTP